MDVLFKIVLCVLSFNLTLSLADTYKAAVIQVPGEDVNTNSYVPLIYESSKMNADILVLPSSEISAAEIRQEAVCSMDKYDEIVSSISDAVKKARLYVVVHLLEKIRCQNNEEVIRNNLVFGRDGTIVSLYRKPLQGSGNCNITNTNMGTFTTDFGVTFGVLMEEDLVLKNVNELGVKNFVLAGQWTSNVPFLSANQFTSSWAYTTGANLISSKGIFAGRRGLKTADEKIMFANLNKNGGIDGGEHQVLTNRQILTRFPGEDLSQYTIKPVDIAATTRGSRQTVCHGQFCCEFSLKTSFLGNPKEVTYGLVAFEGVQYYDRQHSIGVQSCALVACAGLYKRSCFVGSENTTNIAFEEVTISGNFSKNSVQFPSIYSTSKSSFRADDFKLEEASHNQKQVTAKLRDTQDLIRFGIFSRDYSKDFNSFEFEGRNKTDAIDVSDYISGENVQEFFDYLWIRLRIVIVVVSIYVLEMM